MNDTKLTDTERDILLTHCECSHTINDHGSIGHCWLCLDDGRPDCAHDFEGLLAERVARIVAARVAAARAELAQIVLDECEELCDCDAFRANDGEWHDPACPTTRLRAAVAVPEPGNQP